MSNTQDGLRALHDELRKQFRSKWKRSLPFYEEMLGDAARWDRAKFLGFGEGTSVYESSHIYGDVKVGGGTWIGPFTILDGSGGLEIGNCCSISSGAQIYSHETVEWALTGGKAEYRYKPTRIGNHCFIGSLAVIRMGVKIGDHVLVGAHSFVNTDVPSNSVVMGCPGRIIGKVEVMEGTARVRYFDDQETPSASPA
jgi:acetyltransferase-like isoleucine patch superfamily enzyme